MVGHSHVIHNWNFLRYVVSNRDEIMRTIKFRGKRVDNGEWVYGSFIKFSNGKTEIHTTFEDEMKAGIITSGLNEVIYATVGQFTGLTDKNGKEIYEGDVVASVNYDGTISKNIVFYHDGNQGYGCYLPFGNDMDSCMGSDVKVIGNIHDNPELLGEHK